MDTRVRDELAIQSIKRGWQLEFITCSCRYNKYNKYKMSNSATIPANIYTPAKKIVERVLKNINPNQLSNINLMECIILLDKDLTQWSSILHRLQTFLKNIKCLELKTAQKNAPTDFQKSIELTQQHFRNLQLELSNNKKKVDGAERTQTIINFITQLNYDQISQDTHKNLVQLINNSEHLQGIDKETLQTTSKKMLDYEISLRKTQGNPQLQLNYIRKFANTASNPKYQEEDLKRQFLNLTQTSREIVKPLVAQMLRLKSFHKGFVDQVISQKAKIKPTKIPNQTQDIYLVRQKSITDLLEEAKVFKVQNQWIKIVLVELANLTKITKKQQLSELWQNQRKTQISQVKQENQIYLSTLFEHLLSLRNTSPQKNVNQQPLDLKKQKAQMDKWLKNNKQPEVIKDNLSNSLLQAERKNKQLKAELQKANAVIEERAKQMGKLQLKLRQNQNKFKTLQAETNKKMSQFANSGTRSQADLKKNNLKLQQDNTQLKKKTQQLEQDLNDVISQYDQLAQQFQQLQTSCLTKEDQIKQLQTSCLTKEDQIKQLEAKIKAKEGNKVNNEQEVQRQAAKLRKNISDTQQVVEQLRQELASAKNRIKDLERQLNQVRSGGNPQNGKRSNNNDSIVSALRQNDRINKQTITQLRKQHARLNNEVRTLKNQLQSLTTECQTMRKCSEDNVVNLSKLASIEKQLIQSESNYIELKSLYTQVKNQVQQEKGRATNTMKAGGQFRQKVVQELQFQLKQKELDVQRFTKKFLKQTSQKDQQIAQLKIEIAHKNTQLDKLRDTNDIPKLNQKTTDLQKELEFLVKENSQLKINLQKKEREVLEIQINKIDQRK